MTTRVFTLPDLGEGLSEAELVRWLVAVGDTIVVDQPIAEVETAKSVVEVPSPFAGVVETLHGTEGEALTVGEPLLSVADGPVAERSRSAEPSLAESTVDASPTEEEVSDGDLDTAALRQAQGPGLLDQQGAGSGNVLVGYGTTETTHTTRRRRRRAASATAGGRVASASERRWSSSEAYRAWGSLRALVVGGNADTSLGARVSSGLGLGVGGGFRPLAVVAGRRAMCDRWGLLVLQRPWSDGGSLTGPGGAARS
ncbi:biotin/lipoyl-containing protein [Rathayibacter soli]|uniref:biotin/lipoyl-containing protein n=1 Tax=Rathayibacter soli TaxID=3144168 RepID=UPI0027E4BC17|nr:biotin/lipoyl-containing protein [Glaciibacter superstes]